MWSKIYFPCIMIVRKCPEFLISINSFFVKNIIYNIFRLIYIVILYFLIE